jgi:hypothetical protein
MKRNFVTVREREKIQIKRNFSLHNNKQSYGFIAVIECLTYAHKTSSGEIK